MQEVKDVTTSTEPVAAPLKQLQTYLEAATKAGLPLALWRQPLQDTKHLLVSYSPEIEQIEPDIEELSGGFLVHPFASSESDGAYYLPADLYWNTGMDTTPEPSEG
ncbi:MAG TPA: hypothetical protein DCE41_22850, partial [Cytophagales bacterium]|nr:hypothetical protein [Cytophagales bacterium]